MSTLDKEVLAKQRDPVSKTPLTPHEARSCVLHFCAGCYKMCTFQAAYLLISKEYSLDASTRNAPPIMAQNTVHFTIESRRCYLLLRPFRAPRAATKWSQSICSNVSRWSEQIWRIYTVETHKSSRAKKTHLLNKQ